METYLSRTSARLRGAFGPVIPRLIELLSSHDPVVQSAAVSTLSQLGRYGELRRAILVFN